jgi:hypothetical protein
MKLIISESRILFPVELGNQCKSFASYILSINLLLLDLNIFISVVASGLCLAQLGCA